MSPCGQVGPAVLSDLVRLWGRVPWVPVPCYPRVQSTTRCSSAEQCCVGCTVHTASLPRLVNKKQKPLEKRREVRSVGHRAEEGKAGSHPPRPHLAQQRQRPWLFLSHAPGTLLLGLGRERSSRAPGHWGLQGLLQPLCGLPCKHTGGIPWGPGHTRRAPGAGGLGILVNPLGRHQVEN